jgi:hypothetical protein
VGVGVVGGKMLSQVSIVSIKPFAAPAYSTRYLSPVIT